MISTAIQNTFIKAAANLTAQLAVQWKSHESQPLDVQRILEFAVFGFVGAHIGYVWHHFLEDKFPTHTAAARASPPPIELQPGDKDKDAASAPPPLPPGLDPKAGPLSMSWRNIVAKLVADQTVGLSFMIVTFLIITNIARVPHLVDVFEVIEQKLWMLVLAGWHLWPLVAVCNFVWVPVRWRVLVSSCVGFAWNIFLSVVSMAKPVVSSVQPGQ
jgi:protein Mpv17